MHAPRPLTFLPFALVSLALSASRPALAQRFYDSGTVSVALERGFGIHHVRQSRDNPDTTTNATTIGIGWYGALTPFHWTRAAIDVFVVPQLSVGGSLAFFSQSGDADSDGVLFAPRVGYAIPLSRVFAFWPRGGITLYDVGNRSVFGPAGEAMFLALPSPNWGILFGATLDLGLFGSVGNDNDYSDISFAIPAVGVLGVL